MKEKKMSYKNVLKNMTMVCLLVTISSCGVKYYDIVKSEFPQCPDTPDHREVAARYVRKLPIYDEFQTKAIFNALWLSDPVRTAYTDVYSSKRGLDCEAREALLKRQLEENKYWVSMYVLADIRDNIYTSLSDPNSLWTLSLQIDCDKRIVPESIKEVDLAPEIKLFFGEQVNFKTAYLVKFPITSDIADRLTRRRYKELFLMVSSVYKECKMVWNSEKMKCLGKVVKNEDFYWG